MEDTHNFQMGLKSLLWKQEQWSDMEMESTLTLFSRTFPSESSAEMSVDMN